MDEDHDGQFLAHTFTMFPWDGNIQIQTLDPIHLLRLIFLFWKLALNEHLLFKGTAVKGWDAGTISRTSVSRDVAR
jgi:hypothetical protein